MIPPTRMTTPSKESLEEFETRSLTMAAYLACKTDTPALTKRSEPAGETVRSFGVWRFPVSTDLEAAIEEFQNGTGLVEPTEFHNMMSQMRREVITLIEE